MYEVKGRDASDFQELKSFHFSIAIEDGLIAKEYLVAFEVTTIPQLFLVGKRMGIVWYGDADAAEVSRVLIPAAPAACAAAH